MAKIKGKTPPKKEKPRKKPPKNYHKYYLVIRNKKGKQVAANFGLKKYTEGKTIGKSFYLIFNPDGIPYTPAFIEQNIGLKMPQEEYLKQFEKKVKRNQLKYHHQMKVPKPRGTAAHYCAVCKQHFDVDYFEHIVDSEHRKIINEDQYQKRIRKLQKFYNNRKMRRWQKQSSGNMAEKLSGNKIQEQEKQQ